MLRQCFTEFVGWTQTTNNPAESDLHGIVERDGGYVLDGMVRPYESHTEILKVKQADSTMTEEPMRIRRTVHGPVVAERRGMPIAMRVVALDRPKMFEQLWRMGLVTNFQEWDAAMRMHQLPLFNTAYADRDGRIADLYSATLWKHATGDYRFWQGVVTGDNSSLIASEMVPYDEMPKVVDPSTGWVENANDMPWTSTYPRTLDATKFAAGFAAPQGITQRAQRGIRILSGLPEKISFEDIRRGKLDTHVETADQFVDDLVAIARARGTARARQAAEVLARWDRQSESDSVGMLIFYRFMQGAGPAFGAIGGVAVPTDDRLPLETPRGFKAPERAVALLDTVVRDVERQYGTLDVKWGDVLRFRRGAIRTINVRESGNGTVEAVSGDTFYAVTEFSTPQRGEVLLNYGNWSKAGSRHIDDQLPLASRKQLRPMWRARTDIEANLESRKALDCTRPALVSSFRSRMSQGGRTSCNSENGRQGVGAIASPPPGTASDLIGGLTR